MEPKVTWKKMFCTQVKMFVKSAIKTYGCSEEEAYSVLHKVLCSWGTHQLVKKLMEKNEE